MQLSEHIAISKIYVPERFIGKSIVETDIRGRYGLNIILIERDGSIIDAIKPDYILQEHDILFVYGDKEGLKQIS